MSKFLGKLIIFLSPLIAWILIANFCLPIDFYYSRSWEALSPKRLPGVWFSFFYPSQYLDKIEKGDLGPHTEYAVNHRAIWQTDKYGMRNASLQNSYDIVVVGDSTAVGAGLSQDETLASQVAAATGSSTYSYTINGLESFLAEPRFTEHRPQVIIMSRMERMLPNMELPPNLALIKPLEPSLWQKIKQNTYFSKLAIFFDRAFDPTLVKYLKFKITGQKSHFYTYVHDRVLFFSGESANDPVPDEQLEQTIAALLSYSKQLKSLGYRFIFVPAPNKENIYYTMMPNQTKPVFLQQLIAGLKQAGVDVVDTQSLFDKEFEKQGPVLYYSDDTHWSPLGVKLVASEIAKLLKK